MELERPRSLVRLLHNAGHPGSRDAGGSAGAGMMCGLAKRYLQLRIEAEQAGAEEPPIWVGMSLLLSVWAVLAVIAAALPSGMPA